MSKTVLPALETYQVEAEVGRDDLTIAYRARRLSDDTPVLLKVVAPQFTFDAWFVRRFKDAVHRNVHLEHPNIIKTLEAGEREDLLYMAQEWLDAEPLADYLSQNAPLPVTEVIALVKQIAAALDYAHSKAIRHGDLTDASIFVRDGRLWLADFGLTQTTEGTSLAKKGFAVGNPAYLAPERVRGESPSRPADLYALGVLTYQMLTGQLPFAGEPAAVLHAQVYEPPAPPHVLNPALRPAISDVVLRMLSKGLELRHSTGAEFARALQVAAEGSAPVRPISRPQPPVAPEPHPPPPPLWRRFAFWVFVLTPVVGCALAGGFWAINRWAAAVTTHPTPAAAVAPAPTAAPTFRLQTPTLAPTPTPPPPPTPTPRPAASPTPTSPAPGEPVIAAGSPFSNLVLAHDITPDHKPDAPAAVFAPTQDPIYLFFDYRAIAPGTPWGVVWKWDEVVLEKSEDVWPEDYGVAGTAWVYFAPAFGFQPGPYSVLLQVNGETVATVPFLVQSE